MSEINEDIIDDIGDVDTDLTGADEDELLLSDDESFSCRLSQEQEEDLLLFENEESNAKPSKPNQIEPVAVASDDAPQSSIACDIETSESAPESSTVTTDFVEENNIDFVSGENDLVTSTNRDDEENLSQTTDCQIEQKDDESDLCSSEQNAQSNQCDENDDQSFSNVESSDSKFEQPIVTSVEPADDCNSNNGIFDADFDGDDYDDVRERRNPKTCVERELPQPAEKSSNNSNSNNNNRHGNNMNFSNFQRNRNLRGPPPNQQHPGPSQMGGDNFNPAFGPQFRGGLRPMQPPQQEGFFRCHPMMMMRAPPAQMNRMPLMQPNRMQMPPHGIGPPRMQRGPFPPQPNMGFNNSMPPRGMMRPRVQGPNPHPMMRGQAQGFPPFPQQNHPGNIRIMRTTAPMQPHSQPMNMRPSQPPQPLMSVGGPRKVLINPNFKGGVQAATNQLMMDTMKNSQKMENDREAELLRQQEAFINQNRMHIEKRRRSREYSPERERSFSPQRRRERDNRKPHFRENRPRRARSGDRDFDAKRRRSDPESSADKKDPKTDEDEETRAYRLEIEKQKALREKILRDKEMRRRKAAEDIRKEDDKKSPEESVQKLTPIIVTEKKIISLKKKPIESPDDQAQQPTMARRPQTSAAPKTNRAVDVAVPRGLATNRKVRLAEDDEYDEDELLADSPPSSSTLQKGTKPTTIFGNRRVVVRNAADASNADSDRVAAGGNAKRIFNRLDKKVIGVNESAKQKIQRIVITNND